MQVDVFYVEAVDLIKPVRILIGHDEREPGAGWFLDKVVITYPSVSETSNETSEQQAIFLCNR